MESSLSSINLDLDILNINWENIKDNTINNKKKKKQLKSDSDKNIRMLTVIKCFTLNGNKMY